MTRQLARTVSLASGPGSGTEIDCWLVVDGSPGDRVRVPEGRVLVGRSAECDLVLDDPFVSDRHFAIGLEGGAPILRDLGSRNGTHVNGLRVGSTVLAVGVRIDAGRTRMQCVEEPARSTAARLLGRSRGLHDAVRRIDRYAPLTGPVLLRGESGTGKEIVARALHECNERRKGPFVAVNCAGFSPELVDSELFGHERGAFTGAVERRRGAFELAQHGTLFLDELCELPLPQQAKLLRVLESHELRRVGGEEAAPLDVRVVAATNADLEIAVSCGQFRADLYHRLAVLEIRLPPLRARLYDLPTLARSFFAEVAPELGARQLSPAAMARLAKHGWPGNVRELRNVLYRAAASVTSPEIQANDLELAVPREPTPGLASAPRRVRHDAVRTAVEQHGGNLSAAARALGVPRSTMRGWAAQAKKSTAA